jgi:hypothetical protein
VLARDDGPCEVARRLQPAKDAFNQSPLFEADRIARMARGASIYIAASLLALVLVKVRCYLQLSQFGDQLCFVLGLVCCQRDSSFAAMDACYHFRRRIHSPWGLDRVTAPATGNPLRFSINTWPR